MGLGIHQYGRIGDNSNVSSATPIQIGTDTDWKFVSIGSQYITAIKTDGSLWAWAGMIMARLAMITQEINTLP